MPKYKFRKMYFICQDKKVIAPNVQMTNAYQFKDTADSVCKSWNQPREHFQWEDKTKPLSNYSVEGFYLVPEALYEEVLKKWVEDKE